MLCRHNLRVYGHDCMPIVADVNEWFPNADLYFMDPARRHNGRRVKSLEQSQPSLEVIQKLLQCSPNLALKVSPALDYTSLPFECEIEVIAVGKECREIMLWSGELSNTSRRATLLPQKISLDWDPEAIAEKSPPRMYIYEVPRAALRAGLLETLAIQHHLFLLDPNLGYLTEMKTLTILVKSLSR